MDLNKSPKSPHSSADETITITGKNKKTSKLSKMPSPKKRVTTTTKTKVTSTLAPAPLAPWYEQSGYQAGYIILVSLLLLFNMWQVGVIKDALGGGRTNTGGFISFSGISLGKGKGTIIGPILNPDGKTTKLVEWPTISETPKIKKDQSNPTQEAVQAQIPKGTPWYVSDASETETLQGISFDDPLTSQKKWAQFLGGRRFGGKKLELTPEQEKRWEQITNMFTCDYCCGGPKSVTRIAHCGCAHSYAWQGMARFFIKYYGDKYSDEEIMGEMTKWKGIWYSKGMVMDYLVFKEYEPGESVLKKLNPPQGGGIGIVQQFSTGSVQGESTANTGDLEDLPGMVGGC